MRVGVVVFVGLIAAVPSVVVLWLVAELLRWIGEMLEAVDTSGSVGQRLDELRALLRCSTAALGALSLALTAVVLTIGGLWKVLPFTFPGRDVVLIGAFLTGVFAAVYELPPVP